METSECLKYDLSFANLQLYELLIATRMFHENIYLIGLSSNPEIYREKALEIAKQFQLDCFKCAYNKNMQIFFASQYSLSTSLLYPSPKFLL